jgi:Na+-transporting methylmalonyl-CoA/oxaloacetate decarboxylase gamma subunit
VPEWSLDDIMKIVREFQNWSPPRLTLYVVSLLSIVTTVINGRLLSGSRMLVFAGGYLVLYFFGMVGNFIGRYVPMEATTDLQKAIVATIAGQALAVVVLFIVFKRNE